MTSTLVEWASDAACRGAEGSLFYAADHTERKELRMERERMAKRICAECDVRDECLRSALDANESYGIWGGLNEIERRALTRT